MFKASFDDELFMYIEKEITGRDTELNTCIPAKEKLVLTSQCQDTVAQQLPTAKQLHLIVWLEAGGHSYSHGHSGRSVSRV